MSHWLSYSNSDQALFRNPELDSTWDSLVVPGTLAAYYFEGTGGFVLAQERPYIIDPRTPLLQTNEETRRPEPRASHLALLQLHDPSDALQASWPREEIPIDHWQEDGVWEETVRRVLDFQEQYAMRASGKIDKYTQLLAEARGESLRLISDDPPSPARFVPPYWACTGTNDPWWPLTRAAIRIALDRFEAGVRVMPILALTKDTPVARFCDLIHDLPDGCNQVFCWRGSWNEAEATDADVGGWVEALKAAEARSIDILNLYGGYLSVLLSTFGLAGLNHGVGYSEFRDVRRLGETGAPPTRYYIGALHKFETVPNAQPIIDHLPREWECDCPVCRTKRPNPRIPLVVAELSPEERKQHFLYVRAAEIAAMESDAEAAIEQLVDRIRWLRSHPQPSAISGGEADRLETWVRAIRLRHTDEESAREEAARRIEEWRNSDSRNDDQLLSEIAESLPGNDAQVDWCGPVSVARLSRVPVGFRAELRVDIQSQHRTSESDPDTFGPNDLIGWEIQVEFSLRESGEIRTLSAL